MSFLFVRSLSWRITKKRFLLDLHKGFCSARSAVVNAAERHCPLVAKLHIAHVVMLGVENSSFLFDSQPKAWRSEKGPSDTCTNDHHAQWKNWHMSDRAQESGEYGRVNAFLLLILIVVKLMLSSTCQHFIKDTWILLSSLNYSLYLWRRSSTEGSLLWWNFIFKDAPGVSTNLVCSIL